MNVAIIVAAGQGTRFGAERAKQFREIAGIPVLIHTLRRFDQCASINEIVVVLQPEETSAFPNLAGKYGLQRKLAHVVAGGATRTESVSRGLQAVCEATAEIVVVHDGVRPLVTPNEIDRTVSAAQTFGAAILVAPAFDTIKEVMDGSVVRTLDRSILRRALTPQAFQYGILKRAYEHASEASCRVTDDSSLVEGLGVNVATVDGNPRNIKITRPEDLELAEILLRSFDEI